MPGAFQVSSPGVPNTLALPAVRSFGEPSAPFEYPSAITGTAKDSTGAALAGCTLVLFRTADNSIAAQGVSDGSGNYSLGASQAVTHYITAYKAGSPDVAGTTVNTLTGA